MKLVSKNINKDGAGEIKLYPNVVEDMWHVYNLIAVGDRVTATSFRKINQSTSTGSVNQTKIQLKLTIEVENIEFDQQSCEIRIKGKNMTENEHVKMGQYHTIELALNRNFTVEKDNWDSIYLQRVDEACDLKLSAEIAAVVMQPGLANVCLVTTHMTQVRQKIEVSIPRKRLGGTGSTSNSSSSSSTGGTQASATENAHRRFFTQIYEAIKRHVDFSIIKCVILASPGFLKEDFFKFMVNEALRLNDKELIENKSKFLLCHASSGFKHSLKEVFADGNLLSKIENTKAFGEIKALENFHEMLNTDPDRAYYGFNHVKRAHEQFNAIETLLITDELFRNANHKERQKYVDLVESVKNSGGDVKIFSTLHVSGEQLNQLTGIAAILRFPLPETEVVREGEDLHETKDEPEQKINQFLPPEDDDTYYTSTSEKKESS